MNNKYNEKIMKYLFLACGFLAVLFVLIISIFLIVSGLPAIKKIGFIDFIFGTKWASTSENPSYGILPFILTSIYGSLASIIIAVPISILCAVFISSYTKGFLNKLMVNCVNLLAAIPSVVYGLVGMMTVVPFVRKFFNLPDGANLMSAIIVLSIMILPTVISVSTVSIKAVKEDIKMASLALGATKTETIFKIVLPAAKNGILTAVILGIGRSIGEAMAVMMVSGNVANMPKLFSSVRFITTAIASEMSYSSGLQREALFSIALVLFFFIICINILLYYIINKQGDK